METDRAPITQLMLTVQFTPSFQPLNALEVADIYAQWRDRFPVFAEVQRAGPMPTDANTILFETGIGPARYRFADESNEFAAFLQDDRFSFSWQRTQGLDEASGYPGFSAVLEQAQDFWMTMLSIFEARGLPLTTMVGEIIYNDLFDVEQGGGRLSSIYKLINPDFKSEMVNYGFNWTEPFRATGFIQGQIQGPVFVNDGSNEPKAKSMLQTVGRFKLEHGWEGLVQEFIDVHDEIGVAFKRLVHENNRPK